MAPLIQQVLFLSLLQTSIPPTYSLLMDITPPTPTPHNPTTLKLHEMAAKDNSFFFFFFFNLKIQCMIKLIMRNGRKQPLCNLQAI